MRAKATQRHLPKGAGGLINEGLVVPANVVVLDRRENANFVESVLLFFFGELSHLDFFESINLPIDDSVDMVDAAVGTLT